MYRIKNQLHPKTFYFSIAGLFGLSHSVSDEEAHIRAFPPGHVEVYDLDLQGRAHLKSRTAFNRPGQPPMYKTLATPDCKNPSKISTVQVG